MQVYAAALVHTAFRVAQGHIAQASGTQPEAAISGDLLSAVISIRCILDFRGR